MTESQKAKLREWGFAPGFCPENLKKRLQGLVLRDFPEEDSGLLLQLTTHSSLVWGAAKDTKLVWSGEFILYRGALVGSGASSIKKVISMKVSMKSTEEDALFILIQSYMARREALLKQC